MKTSKAYRVCCVAKSLSTLIPRTHFDTASDYRHGYSYTRHFTYGACHLPGNMDLLYGSVDVSHFPQSGIEAALTAP